MTIQFAYVPYVRILKFLEGEQGDTNTPVEWNVYKNFPRWMDVKQLTIKKPPRAYVVNIYGINLFNFFHSYTKDEIIYVLSVFWFRYQCKYGPKDYRENSIDIWSIKWRCLASSSIKHLYTWLMWLKSRYIIRPIHELMGHSHMVNMTQNPFLVCLVMLHTCHKYWRTTYGPN